MYRQIQLIAVWQDRPGLFSLGTSVAGRALGINGFRMSSSWGNSAHRSHMAVDTRLVSLDSNGFRQEVTADGDCSS